MALTQRGKVAIGVAATAVVALLAVLAFTGNAPGPLQDIVDKVAGPDPCPLTGELRAGGRDVPRRSALAVKVENSPDSRPQAGLAQADVVYEEPVEGGLTRFIAIYQCRPASRIGPVRSARMTDTEVLVQFGSPMLAYAGGVEQVEEAIADAGLIDLSYFGPAGAAYMRDESREAPHNVYTRTRDLYRSAEGADEPPAPVFSFDERPPDVGRRASRVRLLFSASYADVIWEWDRGEGRWLRWHGDDPHVVEGGRQVSAANVVVMHVKVRDSTIVDVAGNPSPEVRLTGKGKAWIFRDGKVIAGRWRRPTVADVTAFVTRSGDEIALSSGVTWIELVPTTVEVEVAR